VNPLDHGDRRHVEAAEGWLMLGNCSEAEAELARVGSEGRGHPDVLRVQYQLLATVEKWDDAYLAAASLVSLLPDEPDVWIWRAYAARRMAGGGLERALEALRPAVEKFANEPILPFNIACYCCQLGQLAEARNWLERAIRIGGSHIRELAAQDPDLQPLRDLQEPEK
jgi:tetratricopeptide (TPR) repeat protein